MHNKTRKHERIAYVLQGGGALGSYQFGACQALLEENYTPDWLAGVSIGSINSAIIAGNSPNDRLDKLAAFWKLMSQPEWGWLGAERSMRALNKALYDWWGGMYSILFGKQGFFTPNYCNPLLSTTTDITKLGYYCVSSLRSTLEELVDFDRINHPKNKIVLSLGAVNIQTGRMRYFNNVHHTITPEHVIASGSLAPGFPATEIDGEYYWDGGMHSNTPLTVILEAKAPKHTLCFAIDLFSSRGNIPTNFQEIESRRKDIVYSSHAQHTTLFYTISQNLRHAIHVLEKKLPENVKKDPEVRKILNLGVPKTIDLVRIVYHDCDDSLGSKDYNFGAAALETHRHSGYLDTKAVLANRDWEKNYTEDHVGVYVYGNVQALRLAKEDLVSLDDR